VGRFPRHGDPQTVARRGDLRAVRPPGQQRQAQKDGAFERGDTREPPRRGSRAVVDRATPGCTSGGFSMSRAAIQAAAGCVAPICARVIECGDVPAVSVTTIAMPSERT